MSHDVTKKEQFVSLRASGKSYSEIAQSLGICRKTAIEWAKELSREIMNAKALELDLFYTQNSLHSKKRIELLTRQMNKIEHEIDRQTGRDGYPAKLGELLLKISNLLDAERRSLHLTYSCQEANGRLTLASTPLA